MISFKKMLLMWFVYLTEREILAHANDIERSLPAKIDNQLRRLYLIVAGKKRPFH